MENGLCVIHNRGTKYELPGEVTDKLFNSESGASKYIRHQMIQTSKTLEFNFQRHQTCTNSIMDYFLGEELHVPNDVCPSKFRDELIFWGVKEHAIGSCCLAKYVSFFEEKESRDKLENNDKKEKETEKYINTLTKGEGWREVQAKVWQILEYPRTSIYARVFWVVSNVFVVASLIEVVYLTVEHSVTDTNEHLNGINDVVNTTTTSRIPTTVRDNLINYFENVLMGYFTLEMLLRCVFFPLPWRQFITVFNVVDGFALAAMYANFGVFYFGNGIIESPVHVIIDSIQVIRIFRLFRLVKYSTSFRILTYTFIASASELMLLLFCLFSAVFVFSVLAYATYDAAFISVSESFWWAIITLTTVGYGDITPVSIPGRLVAAGCAVSGVLLVSMLVPILVNNLLVFYSHSKVLKKRECHRKEQLVEGPMKLSMSSIEKRYKFV